MTDQDRITQVEASLDALQHKLERVLDQYRRLVQENRSLRERHDQLAHERADLVSNSEQTRHRVEAMLSRLKDLETRV